MELVKATLAGTKLIASIFLLLATQQVYAGAFELHEQSMTFLGDAYSGSASSSTPDASATYYNPAGLSWLPNNQIMIAGAYLKAHIKLYDAAAKNNAGTTVIANPDDWPSSHAVIPALNLGWRINRDWVFGFSVNAPFGLNTKYSNVSIARYMGTVSKLTTVNLNPSLAYRINKEWSIGAGFDAMLVMATLSSAINFIGEGYTNNYGRTWTYGYHIGLMFQPSCDTRMGLVYHSLFNPRLKGTVDTLNYPAPPVPGTVYPAPGTLNATLHLPDRLTYGIMHQYDQHWTGLGEIELVHWSRLQNIQINYNTGAYTLENLHWKNTMRLSLGANYKLNCSWLFKGGLSFDQSPVPALYRTSRLPDADRWWLAIGAKFNANKYASLDIAYAHLFFDGATIAEVGWVTGDTKRNLYGNYRSSADLIGVQLTWNFV